MSHQLIKQISGSHGKEVSDKIAVVIKIIKKKTTTNPFEYSHAVYTLEWLLKIKTSSSWELMVAALLHDCERYSLNNKKLRLEDFNNFEEYKRRHQKQSAVVAKQVLSDLKFIEKQIETIVNIIANHEFGIDKNSKLLMQVESFSFFDKNWVRYFRRKDKKRYHTKAKFMYNRLSDENKRKVKNMCFTKSKNDKKESTAYQILMGILF